MRIGRIFAIIRNSDSNLQIKLCPTLLHTELPRNYMRTCQDPEQLWLTEYHEIIEPFQIVDKVSVWLCDTHRPPSYKFMIKEILYHLNGRIVLRDISLRHRHSSERVSSNTNLNSNCK